MPSSSEITCKKDGCTLADTGLCMFNNTPAVCPERLASIAEGEITNVANSPIGGPVLEAPAESARFATSYTLSPLRAAEMWRLRDCKTIGILGIPNTGKTAFLVSLYLLLSDNKLADLQFRNSKTLMAFEEISRGARKWKEGDPPDQMTMHTEIKDERTAGFLHLKLLRQTNNRLLHLLFPDLPGEWTNSLISKNRVDRLSFLQHVSVIWLMTNGQDIVEAKTRMNALYHIEVLLDRIIDFLGSVVPSIVIVVTHFDLSGTVADKFIDLLKTYQARGLTICIKEIAAFAAPETGLVSGHGIEELVSELFQVKPQPAIDFWPQSAAKKNLRSFMNIKSKV